MAWCPFAVHKPIVKKRSKITPRAIIAHTAVSGADSLFGYFSGVGDDSHFYIRPDGGLEQYVDTTESAYANRDANSFAISFESADGKDPAKNPWTPAQLATIIRLVDWLADVHPTIPRKQIEGPYGSGIGWHAMFGAPSAWTKAAGKTCPAGPRIAQMKSSVIPAFVSGAVSGGGGAASGGSTPPPIQEDEDNLMIVPAAADDYVSIPCNGKTLLFISTAFGRKVTVLNIAAVKDNNGQNTPEYTSIQKGLRDINPDQPGPISIGGGCRVIQLRYSADHDFTVWCA